MKHILSSGLVAGLVAGLICALLQLLLIQPQILLAERYETGELVHFQGVAGAGMPEAHGEAPAVETATEAVATAEAAAEPSTLRRNALTALFAVLTYAGYGLLLAGAMALARERGVAIGAAQAALWGLAGYLAFQMMPAIGLPPELPGTPAADLTARQIWWAGTAIATVAGLSLLAYGGGLPLRAAGLAVLALPHLIGAPETEAFGGIVPPELAFSFAARTLAVGLITWLVLGLAVRRLLVKDTA